MTLPMSWDEWCAHDAVGLADRVRRGELTPAELARQAAAGIAKVNPALGAVVEVFEDVVEDPLKAGMNPDGPFAGVPLLMKDLGPTLAGRRQEQGSRFMRGNRPAEDAWLTRKMRAAGLNLIGRTTTPEFGVCSSAENPAGMRIDPPPSVPCDIGSTPEATIAEVPADDPQVVYAWSHGFRVT